MIDKNTIVRICEKTDRHWPNVTILAGVAVLILVAYTVLTSGI